MKYFLILFLFYYTDSSQHDVCEIIETEGRNGQICDYHSCRYVTEEAKENVTCKNLDQMHATPDICINKKCTIRFTGKQEILRTNSFSKLSNLEQVFLNETAIKTIQVKAFSNAPSIKLINLGRNQISKIPINSFSQLKYLTSLNLSHNKIDEIDSESFNGCYNLIHLDLSHNNLKNLSAAVMESMVKLEIVNLSSNSLEVMDPNWCLHFHSLKSLLFDHNRMNSLANCTLNFNLEIFSFAHNYLTILNGTFFPLNLKELYLSGNHISILENKPFESLSRLRILDISKNKLKNLPFDIFVDLENLASLDISSNNLMTLQEGVFHGLINLKFINLSRIDSPDLNSRVLYSIRTVQSIDISQNNILYFDTKSLLKFCRQLKNLRINGNSFTCSDLLEILLQAQEEEVDVLNGTSYQHRNLNGIECFDDQEFQGNNNTNEVMDYFNRGFRKSSFFKFFSSFKDPSRNDNQHLAEIKKDLMKNISMEIANSGNKLLERVLSVDKDRTMDGTNEILQRFLMNLDSNRQLLEKNLTSELFNLLDHQSRAALTAENSDMKNLFSLLSDLKSMFVICTLILISLCAVKLFKQFKTHFSLSTFKIDSQELPIIERQNTQI